MKSSKRQAGSLPYEEHRIERVLVVVSFPLTRGEDAATLSLKGRGV